MVCAMAKQPKVMPIGEPISEIIAKDERPAASFSTSAPTVWRSIF